MAQSLEALTVIQVHHLSQGHKPTVGQAHGHTLQGGILFPLIPGQLHPHFHFVATILVDLGDPAVKGGPQLPAKIHRGQAQRFTKGAHLVDQLFPAPGHVVFHIQHPGQGAQGLGHFIGGPFQVFCVIAGQAYVHIPPRRPGLAFIDVQGIQPGGQRHAAAPFPHKLRVANVPPVRRHQLHQHGAQFVIVTGAALGTLGGPEGGYRMADQVTAQGLFGFVQGLLHLAHEIFHGAFVRAGHKAGIGIEHGRLRCGEEVKAQAAAGQQAHRHNRQGQGAGHGGAAVFQAVPGKPAERAFPETIKALLKTIPEPAYRVAAWASALLR